MASHGGVFKNRGIWLVGAVHEKIAGSKLPSNQKVLGRFFTSIYIKK